MHPVNFGFIWSKGFRRKTFYRCFLLSLVPFGLVILVYIFEKSAIQERELHVCNLVLDKTMIFYKGTATDVSCQVWFHLTRSFNGEDENVKV